MDSKLSYLSETFPKIWENVNHQLVEKDDVYLQKNTKDDDPKWLTVLYPALTDQEVTSIEEQLSVIFPDQYKKFLTNHNGADFFDNLFLWGRARTYNREQFIAQEFDLIDKQEEYGQGWEIKPGEIIIASDSLGIIYVLDTHTGKVITHDTEFPDKDKQYDSFNEFLDEIFDQELESYQYYKEQES